MAFLRFCAKIKQVSKEGPSSATHIQDSLASQSGQTLCAKDLGQQFFSLMNNAPFIRIQGCFTDLV
jgi:hypothetical protein